MSSRGSFEQSYVDACRARSESQVAVFRWARYGVEADEDVRFDDLESEYFNNMLLVLEGCFAQRDPSREGVGTPALVEVRRLARALVLNGGAVLEEPEHKGGEAWTSPVLGYRPGDPIRLTADQYGRLSNAFFTEVERHLVDH